MSYPDTPPGAEEELRRFSYDLEDARLKLRDARNHEVAKKHAYEGAKRTAILSAECPKVRRGRDGEPSVTVDERNAWVARQCEPQEFDYEVAKVARQAAQDHLSTLRDQGSIQQSITKSINDGSRMPQGFGR